MKQKDFLLIVLILLMVGVVKFFRHTHDAVEEESDASQPFYEHYEFPNSFPLPPAEFADVRQIIIENPAGSISFLPAENRSITVQSTLVVFHPSKKMVGEIQQKLNVISSEEKNVLRITVQQKSEVQAGLFQVNHTIWLPDGVAVEAQTRYGDIEIAHVVNPLKLDHAYGTLQISDSQGPISMTVANSKLELTNMRGEQKITAKNCEIVIQDADKVGIIPKHCQLKLSDIRQQIIISQALLSKIDVKTAPIVEIFGSGDRITLTDISQSVRINDEFDDIELENIAGMISIQSKRSNLSLRNVQAKDLQISNSYRDTQIFDARFDAATINLHQSDLLLNLTELRTGLTIEGNHSNLTLNFPAAMQFSADLTAKMGSIIYQADSSLVENIDRGQHTLSRKTPSAPQVNIKTSYGDITLKLQEKKE